MTWPARAFMSSTRLRSGGRRLAWLCVLLCLSASAEFGSDLPLGYQEITEVGDGNYRIVARCVETRALLEAIAAKTGKPIVFHQPCNTYVSVLEPTRIGPPHIWLGYIALKGAFLECRLRADGAWHVYALSANPEYQPALTEQEILEEFRVDRRAKSNVVSGINEGLVFCRGTLIPPPYEVGGEITGDGTADIVMNGVTVKRLFRPVNPSSSGGTRQVPDFPKSGQFEKAAELEQYVAYQLYPSLLRTMSPQHARDAVIAFLNTQHQVEAVVEEQQIDEQQIDAPIGNILFQMEGLRFLFPANYDYSVGDVWFPEYPDEPVEEFVKRSVAEIESSLSQNWILIFSDGKYMLPQEHAARLANRVKLAQHLPLPQTECLLEEVIPCRKASREIAANLAGRHGSLISLLEAMGQGISQPAPVQ
jgi:hypothetical protein